MMNQYRLCMILFLVVLGSSCSNNTKSTSPESKPFHNYYTVAAIKQSDFNLSKGDSLQRLLIEQFCEESKGYQKGVWIGLNKCSWAIEKYRLDQNPDILQRNGDELSIQLSNGEKLSFIHQEVSTDKSTFFQLKKHLPNAGYVLIEKIKEGNCSQHLFVRLSDGKKITLNGIPYLTPDEQNFMLNGSDDNTCLNTLEYWSLSANEIRQKWSTSLEGGALEEVKWLDGNTFLGSRIIDTKESENRAYSKFRIL